MPAPAAAPAATAAAQGGGSAATGAGAGGGGQVQHEAEENARAAALAGIAAVLLSPLLVLMVAVGLVVSVIGGISDSSGDDGGGGEYPAESGVPTAYWPMYTTAADHYKVNPYLLAAIHRQETTFSSDPSSREGFNSHGCCAGPMQFNVKGGTWDRHKKGFDPIKDARPKSYPLQRDKLPSCKGVPDDEGCVYDDFDAIAAAAHKIKEDHGDRSLDSKGTRQAVCRYIGACGEVDECTGSPNEYCQVLPRARRWELMGAPTAPGGGAEAAVKWALQQDGTKEQPMGSNCGGPITDWQRRAGGVCGRYGPWCGVFVHEAFLRGGINLPDYVKSVAQTLSQAEAGANGLKKIPKEDIQRGDIVIFQWDGGDPDHMGLATGSYSGGKLHTIEGNTSDAVHKRVQSGGQIVAGVRVTAGGKDSGGKDTGGQKA